ncbi:MAG: OFA family MFS transporter [Oscillospiraceae bacterium]|nr:OFA family MFS transporter [Oscillospiraceae bacterium]
MKTKNRYLILAAGMTVQLCAGIIYGWSVFRDFVAVHLTKDGLPWDSDAAKLTSSIMLSMFVLGIIFGGKAQDKFGPKKVTLAGSILIGAGMALTAIVPPAAPWLVYVTYGIAAGLGVGTVYMATIAAVQKWFPDRRGFASGMIVCAFGFSLVVFMPIAGAMLGSVVEINNVKALSGGIGVPATFLVFGIGFGVICAVSSLFVENPPQGYLPEGYSPPQAVSSKRQYKPLEMLKTKQYYLLAGGLLFTLPSYFVLNPSFKQLAIERGLPEVALLLVMLTGIGSASGRLIVSWVSDKIGRKTAMVSIAVITLVSSLIMIPATGIIVLICIMLISFAFGGAASVYSAMTAESFGTKYGGVNFGLVMLGFGVSALVFQYISTLLPKEAGEVVGISSFIVAAATCVIAIVLVLLMDDPNKVK